MNTEEKKEEIPCLPEKVVELYQKKAADDQPQAAEEQSVVKEEKGQTEPQVTFSMVLGYFLSKLSSVVPSREKVFPAALIFCFLVLSAFVYTTTRDGVALRETVERQKGQIKKLALVTEHLFAQVKELSPTKDSPLAQADDPALSELDPANLSVAEVIVNKANLRLAPSYDSGISLSVAKGSKLLVEVSEEGWHRVIAPTGDRLWVADEVVFVSKGR